MRKLRKPVSVGLAGLALFVLTACGGASTSNQPAAVTTPACVNASAPNKAHVVVEHQSGTTVDRCVGFTTAKANGADLMTASGIDFKTQHFSFGDAACAIDSEPASYSTCLPQGAPYWALWTSTGGGPWVMAQTGFAAVLVANGDALGWRYTPSTETNPSPPPPAKK